MVSIFNRLGLSKRRQANFLSLSRANRTSFWVCSDGFSLSSESGKVSFKPCFNALRMRFFISPAALRVKVMLRTCSGNSTPPNSFRYVDSKRAVEGDVLVEVKEYYKKSEFIKAKLNSDRKTI